MKIYSWNVNGIRAVLKKGTFQKFLADHQPDILCLQETKAERDQVVIEVPAPELDAWADDGAANLPIYPAGSSGPSEADELLARNGRRWRSVGGDDDGQSS